MVRTRIGALCVFLAGLLGPGIVGGQELSVTITPRPTTVRPGEQIDFELAIRNGGAADRNIDTYMQLDPSMIFVSASGPPEWNIRLTESGEFQHQISFGPARLARGASVTFLVRMEVPATQWPGATLFAVAPFLASNTFIEVSVAGSGSIPASSAQLFTTGAETTALPSARSYDLGYDPSNGTYLVVGTRPGGSFGSTQFIVVTAVNAAGTATGAPLDLEGSSVFFTPPSEPRVAYSGDISDGVNSGGFMLTWRQGSTIYARPIVTQGLSVGTRGTISDSSPASQSSAPAIAYSRTSRVFLIAWSTSAGRVMARRVGLNGQPIGTAIDVGAGRSPAVAWNPVTNEFGLAWSSACDVFCLDVRGGFARLSPDGAVLGRLDRGVGRYIAVNTVTGNYVAVLRRGHRLLGAEISRTGRVVSRGLISDMADGPLSFNPVSETFLVADSSRMVELNGHGAPLSSPVSNRISDICGGGAVVSRTDAAEWRLLNDTFQVFRMCTIGVGTFSRNGGSDARLGGCTTADPFEAFGGGHCYDGGWLPPGIDAPGVPTPIIVSAPAPPPGDCATPDPFVALGGGTCSNGGWYPPGITPPPPLPPPGPGGCTTPDPFVALGGGTCFNGGWYPPGMTVPTS